MKRLIILLILAGTSINLAQQRGNPLGDGPWTYTTSERNTRIRVSVVTKEDIEILESVEHEEARNRNTWDFKFIGDDEMLQVIRERKARAN